MFLVRMNKSQWYVLSIFFTLMGMWFIYLDNLQRGGCINQPDSAPLSSVVYFCINGEILEPFIWILIPLGVILLVLGIMEKNK